MKRLVFKTLSVITALCVLLCFMPIVSCATEAVEDTGEIFTITQMSPETEVLTNDTVTMDRFYSSTENTDYTKYFYNQLTANQKKIYDTVWAAGPAEQVRVDVSLSSSTAQQDVISALTALNEDKPLFFWLKKFGYSRMSSYILINFYLDENSNPDWDTVRTKYDAIVSAVDNFKVNGISRHEKLKSIHDTIADKCVYDSELSSANIYDAYGALVAGLCVCEGYAEAFKLICDREGIPCLTVVGTGGGGNHKWNMVLMEDGEWYLVDPTWDDQSSNTIYSYFLIGSNTKAPFSNYSTVADSTVHIPVGKIFSIGTKTFVYPTLSNDTYGLGLLAPNATDIHFDKVRGVIMVGKGITNYYIKFVDPDIFVLNSEFNTTRNGTGVTTSTLTVTDGSTTKEYLVAMRGDINASNSVNGTDYTVLTQVCSTTYKVDEGTAKFYAGDMTQDNAIDGFDAIALDLYQEDMLVFD